MASVVTGAPQFEGSLPTLLTSRARAEPPAQKKERRPLPCAAIKIPEDAEVIPPGLFVRNTFLEAEVPLSPSLQPFYQQRAVQTCPGARAGLLEGLFREAAYPDSMPAPGMRTPLAHLPSPAAYMPPTPTDGVPAKTVVSLAAMLDLPGAPSSAPAGVVPPPAMPAPGTGELPSLGSSLHAGGDCKPCAFLYTKGCESGAMCQFCHLCDSNERKKRRQGKVEAQKTKRREMKAAAGVSA